MKKQLLIFILFCLNASNILAVEIDSIYIGDQIKITTEGGVKKDSIIKIIPKNITKFLLRKIRITESSINYPLKHVLLMIIFMQNMIK